MKRTTFTSVLVLLMGLSAFCQESNFNKLDSLFSHLESHDRFMGSLALSENGKTIYSKTIGYADIDAQQEIDEKTKFRIGSITKMFTSTLTFMAMEENKIDLEQTIETYFPNIENAHLITIGNLLNHRSGIFNFTNRKDFLIWHTIPKTKEEMLQLIAEGKSVFQPNSKAEYSNSNYVLLTFILEDVYKKEYAELIQNKIVKPLQLEHTYLGKKIDTKNNEALSYGYDGSWIKKTEADMSIPLGAGAIVSTPEDLNKFATALFNERLVSKKSLDQMMTFTEGYGMGLFEMPFYDKKGFGHNGAIDGFSSQLAYFPKDNICATVISNGNRYNNNTILIAILSSYYDKPFDIPRFKYIALTSEELDKYLGVYSSSEIPLKITVIKEGTTLMAYATGQSSFPLEAVENDIFEFSAAGIRMEFDPENKTMLLKQGGGVFNYKME
ncbi:serine hydrolase domain-containing protein [Zobellia uliginosa]|uniref:serine hydrolase domain-containing protein n=1 Tax=Zobellia uliginosa TaxID=143224 RepID=UPI0026E44EDB|nr:serine hydrolase domain-containing protein [Zobellia uliginosa]MDO6517375.1 serine hydrolase domain-containing protein [Zobellia uliginosa]